MIQKKAKIVSNENGVKLIRNSYVDTNREYSKSQGAKKKRILDEYTYATQLNELRKVVIALADANAIDASTLKTIDTFIG